MNASLERLPPFFLLFRESHARAVDPNWRTPMVEFRFQPRDHNAAQTCVGASATVLYNGSAQ